MKILKAYKTKLDPNQAQRGVFDGCARAARFVHNWALNDRRTAWDERNERVSEYNQRARFNALKDELCPWIRQYPYTILQEEFAHVESAFKNFWRKWRNGDIARMRARMVELGKWDRYLAKRLQNGATGIAVNPGWPSFASRYDRKRFSLRGAVQVESNRVKLPVIGWVRLAEKGYIPTDGSIKVLFVNISQQGDDWYIALNVEQTVESPAPPQGSILGIDLGYGVLATTSDGTVYENPRVYAQYESKLATLQRELSRRTKGGKNWQKTKEKIAKLNAKIANVRAHVLHNASRDIVRKGARVIAIEDLQVGEMMQARNPDSRKARRAKRFADAGISELKRQIGYKQEWAGGQLFVADSTEPTNRRCHVCGYVQANPIPPRLDKFFCANCNTELDRRLNTATVLVQLATANVSVE